MTLFTAAQPIVRHFHERTGIAFSAGRGQSIVNGIHRAMARAGIANEIDFVHWLETNDLAFDDLVAELTIGETYFLRVPAQFDFIRRQALPALRRGRSFDSPIRAWSCACSSGEEPYSLAMTFEEEGLADQSRILATDISRAALRKAAAASYSAWSFRTTDPQWRLRYFHDQGDRYLLQERIRRKVDFRYLNLAVDAYPSLHSDTWALDLILCRNVLIYFSHEVIERVCRGLFDCLTDGGWLITAPTDPPIDRIIPCEVIIDDGGIYYRKRERASARGLIVPPKKSLPFSTSPFHDAAPIPPIPAAPPRLIPPRPVVIDGQPCRTDDCGAESLELAKSLFRSASYAQALEAIAPLEPTPQVTALRLRILANIDAPQAAQACAEAVMAHPLSVELHFLRAIFVTHMGQPGRGAESLRRVLYLDPSLAIGHFVLATLLQQQARTHEARRAYRNARDLCRSRPADEELPLSEGETAGRLAALAEAQIELLPINPRRTR